MTRCTTEYIEYVGEGAAANKPGRARCAAMAAFARADARDLIAAWEAWADKPDWRWMRRPETGLVMVRGRIGGAGAPFNLGEVTVTRCAVRLGSGETGFAYVLGRDARKAEIAALFDALWQGARRETVEQHVFAPLREAQQQEDAKTRARTAATRVDFFTLVRGESE
ncbi:MAG: phosphonate C-P lyase system protein PhnG [Hyphomicrobiales bacterium]|nr:phosphonate C-P lyase system protein PhnG [Hyphomicrobiales bacterium]